MPKTFFVFGLLLILALVLVSPASAQETPHIANLYISVWPEYDQPGVGGGALVRAAPGCSPAGNAGIFQCRA